ncbi:MAG: RraA family protein, partial [SAR324 cluster bacterium]|nr:RraA family protein [SAR324 cluster bacterium]
LPPHIKPLRNDMVVVGRAMPVLEADCVGGNIASEEKRQPFGLMFQALDDLKSGEVYVATGGTPRYALWGELMSTRARALGAAGAVLNGYLRDSKAILDLDFSAFSWGTYAQDQGARGRVIDFRCAVEFPDGVAVKPGDVIFGDVDGVLVIPQRHEAEIVTKAVEKVHGENQVRKAIEGGMSSREAFETFGIM